MPLYEVEHYIPLSDIQKETLAQSITRIHSRLFTTPSLFVNVRFVSKTQSQDYNFVGGKKRNLNRILAYVRPGHSRTTEDYRRLCDAVTMAWNRVVDDASTTKRPTELHGIFVMGSIIAGTEAGFTLPAAGEDKQWLAANVEQFRERAKYGDEDFKDLLKEMAAREDLRVEHDFPPAYDRDAEADRGGS